ncbi:D-alanine--D-alanine ligase [Patescibacteria group bacterium]|nr:D-alanine--D-alanine ligase [Patescibacteria group bacterium]
MKKIRVGVIFGGRSGEHEVSIVSGQSVMKALDKKKYEVIPLGITKEGKWLSGPLAVKFLKEGIQKVARKTILSPDPTQRGIINIKQDNKSLAKIENSKQIDVMFPVLHGPYGEDGTVQGLMELTNIPYVGANVLGSAVGMDKIIQKQIYKEVKLPIVKYDWFLSNQWKKDKTNILRRIEKKLKYPVFVKPVNLGSSVGISKAGDRGALIKAINLAVRFDRKILIEQSVNNVREIEVAVLGNDDPKASVPGEIIPSNEFYDYDAKYVDGKSSEQIPAKLPKNIIKNIQKMAVEAFKSLDLCGMARVDFFVKKGNNQIILNEVNTIPGFTPISMYPKMWAKSGLSYPKLLDKLIQLAFERHREKNQLRTSFDPGSDWYK